MKQQVNMLVLVQYAKNWQDTHSSLSLIIFYCLIFCLIDLSSSFLSYRLSNCLPPPSNTTQRHRQLRQLVNPDKEAESTSHFDIYRVIFTTSLYNLCPFAPFSLFRLFTCSQIGWQLLHVEFDRKRSQESITAICRVCVCECEV